MKTTTYATLFLLTVALLGSASAAAEEADADTRFHDAYVLEVIDGRVADAARVYLALLEDEQVSKRLRTESRFRFAICTVLLGRPDEARDHLTALIDDADAPPALRKRAEAYRTSIFTMELGTELDKKLKALLFDLGRANPSGREVVKDVYRDFEIIGKPAVPFLKKLLQHSDVRLRQHAYRLLSRMNEPGLGSAWTPTIQAYPQPFQSDMILYFRRHKDERKALEERILALGKPALLAIRYLSVQAFFSREFIRTFAASQIAPATAVAWLGYTIDDADFDQLMTWIDGDDAVLSGAAMDWLLRRGNQHAKADAAFFRRAYTFLEKNYLEENSGLTGEALPGFGALALRMPADVLLEVFEQVLRGVEEAAQVPLESRAARHLINQVTLALDQKIATPAQADRYGAGLLRWIAAREKGTAILKAAGPRGEFVLIRTLAPHIRAALAAMEDEQAARFVAGIFAIEGRANHLHWIEALPPLADRHSVLLWAAAVAAAPDGYRKPLLARMQPRSPLKSPSELLTELNRAMCGLLDPLSADVAGLAVPDFSAQLDTLTAEAVRRDFRSVLEKARTFDAEKRAVIHGRLFAGDARYFQVLLAPLAADAWDSLETDERRRLLQAAFKNLKWGFSDAEHQARALAAAAKVILPHLREVRPSGLLLDLKHHPKRFPVEAWLPLLPEGMIHWHAPPFPTASPEASDEVARRMVADPAHINATVLGYVRRRCSPETQREIFDRLLRSDDGGQRVLAMLLLDANGTPASPEALEAMLKKELASSPSDLPRLRRAGDKLLALRPSEALFPVARALLRSDDAGQVQAGIRMANSLGREDLAPDLRPHLKSMNASIRTRAREALAAIYAIAAIQAGVGDRQK